MIMGEVLFREIDGSKDTYVEKLASLLGDLKNPFAKGDSVGIKLHWGERGNHSYLSPIYAKEISRWLRDQGAKPFVFDTTALYSGGRRTGSDSLLTAKEHGFVEDYLGCPVLIADGLDGKDVVEIPSGYKHFKTVQVASIVEKADGFFIFSHFKGHMAAVFGGAIKNISMGFASRAQKQRMHSDARPKLRRDICTRCGVCVEICPSGAARAGDNGYPVYDLETCIGCAQCIALCPEMALRILWNTDDTVFQEKLVETAAAVWRRIQQKAVLVNALINITKECDCLAGENPVVFRDLGFLGGYHPVAIDAESLRLIGAERFEQSHPDINWRRQFEYATETGFFSGHISLP
ncbi:MAG: DUF362 domain-containing protein [Deltaproteobacteria bacterium]|nr:DUF362 domain-containing protein [Deltaproteobacteria bacterium]